MKAVFSILAASSITLALCGCSGVPVNDNLVVKEIALGADRGRDDSFDHVSPDGRHIAYVARGGHGVHVIVDGQPGPAFDTIWQDSIQFSQDGRHVAYVAGQGDKRLVVVDGRPGPAYDGIGMDGGQLDDTSRGCPAVRSDKQIVTEAGTGLLRSYPFFSLDSRRVAYIAQEAGKWFVVLDGTPGPSYDGIGERSLVCSPDSRHVAYVAIQGNKQFVVLDGKPGPVYDGIGFCAPIFSPDSRRVAWWARRGGKWFAVVDGRPGPACDRVDEVVFSPNSRRVAYVAQRDDNEFVIADGKRIAPDGSIVGSAAVFSPDSRHLAYVQQPGAPDQPPAGLDRVVVDAKPGPAFNDAAIADPTYSSDGRHLAYFERHGDRVRVVLDGKPGQTYDEIRLPLRSLDDRLFGLDTRFNIAPEPLFSPDGRHLAYMARRGAKWMVVEDGKPGPAYEEIGAFSPVFSPDGEHLAYVVDRGKTAFVVVDGKPGPTFHCVWTDQPVFSPDGQHIAYAASDGRGYNIVVDGRLGPAYDDFITFAPIVFDGPTSLHTLVVRGGTVYRLEITIKK
jgi:hypothetical protein